MNVRKWSAVFIMLFFAAFRAQAQSPSGTVAVTDYVHAEMQRQHIPGLSLLVIKDGKIIRA